MFKFSHKYFFQLCLSVAVFLMLFPAPFVLASHTDFIRPHSELTFAFLGTYIKRIPVVLGDSADALLTMGLNNESKYITYSPEIGLKFPLFFNPSHHYTLGVFTHLNWMSIPSVRTFTPEDEENLGREGFFNGHYFNYVLGVYGEKSMAMNYYWHLFLGIGFNRLALHADWSDNVENNVPLGIDNEAGSKVFYRNIGEISLGIARLLPHRLGSISLDLRYTHVIATNLYCDTLRVHSGPDGEAFFITKPPEHWESIVITFTKAI